MYQFVTRDTINIATGLAVGKAFYNPDNLAIDTDGNIYIVEDQRTPNADIWRAIDEDNNGIAEYITHGIALRVVGNDQTYMITATAAPVP